MLVQRIVQKFHVITQLNLSLQQGREGYIFITKRRNKMKTLLYSITLTFAFFFIGCPARSLHPLFTEKDIVFNSSLIGTWLADDVTYTFEQLGDKNYKVTVCSTESHDSSLYTAQLGKLGSHWFLDTYPLVTLDEHHYLSVHVFTRLKLQGDTLRLASLEEDWLSEKIRTKALTITHVKKDDEIILTASTKELQQLLMKYGKENDAFPNEGVFVRE